MAAPRGAAARRRSRHAAGGGEHEGGGAERWLVTYADMLTLLLVLFIVLFAMSAVDKNKFDALKKSLASVFGTGQPHILAGGTGIRDGGADTETQPVASELGQNAQVTNVSVPDVSVGPPVPQTKPDYSAEVAQQLNNFDQIKKSINTALAQKGMAGDVDFAIDERGMVITVVTTDLLFGGNSATLLPAGNTLLGVIAPPLKNYPNNLEVDGYTNQDKVSTAPFESGWALSSARAASVAYYLQSSSIADARLTARGLNDQNPKYPPSDPRASKYNRRVEIVVLSGLPADAGAQLAAAAAGAGAGAGAAAGAGAGAGATS
ncbi:MAG TPA: flagellar motor protein MotB [Jatrophihabitans sp.]|jgi:chemotaxis protein MotB